jgi:hypothetical protein
MLDDPGDDGIEITMFATQRVEAPEQIVFIGQHNASNILISLILKPEFWTVRLLLTVYSDDNGVAMAVAFAGWSHPAAPSFDAATKPQPIKESP